MVEPLYWISMVKILQMNWIYRWSSCLQQIPLSSTIISSIIMKHKHTRIKKTKNARRTKENMSQFNKLSWNGGYYSKLTKSFYISLFFLSIVYELLQIFYYWKLQLGKRNINITLNWQSSHMAGEKDGEKGWHMKNSQQKKKIWKQMQKSML